MNRSARLLLVLVFILLTIPLQAQSLETIAMMRTRYNTAKTQANA